MAEWSNSSITLILILILLTIIIGLIFIIYRKNSAIQIEVINLNQKKKILNLIRVFQDSFLRNQDHSDQDFLIAANTITDLSESENAILATVNISENGNYQINKIVCTHKEFINVNLEEWNKTANQLLSETIIAKKVLILNSPHPLLDHTPIHSFIGIPLFAGAELIGVMGISNRSSGYNKELFFKYESVFSTLSNSILNMKIRKNEKQLLTDLKSLVSSLNDIVFELDDQGRFLRVWSSNNEVLFMPKEHLIGKTINQCLPAALGHICYDALNYVIKNEGTTKYFEYPSMHNDKKWFQAKFFEIKKDTPESTKKFCCVITDITERKLMETEIRDTAEVFKSLSDNVPVLVWMSDIDGNFNFFNKTWFDFTGRTLIQDFGEGWQDLIHPEDRSPFQEKYLLALYERKSLTTTFRMKNKDGEYRWIKTHAVPRNNDRSDFIGFVGSCFDLTEELKLQQSREDHQKFLSEMAKVAKIGGWELSTTNFTFNFSEEVFNILDSANQEEINLSDFIAFFDFASHNEIQKKFTQAFNKNQGFDFTSKLNNNDNWIKVTVKIETLHTGRRIFGVLQDITDQKKSEKELDQQKGLALQSSKMAALGEMAGNISHEINNPLAIIHGSAEQLKRLIDNKQIVDSNVVKIVNRIVNTTQRISKIVKGLRSFSSDAENDPFIATPLTDIVDETLALCESRLKHQGVTLEVNLFDPILKVDCRSIQISQVMLNLINNSTDAIALLPEKWIKISCNSVDENTVDLSITDSGKGIPPEIVAKLMQPFFTTKEVGKGTGLGLYVSRVILSNHGGSLTIDETSPNTRFVLRLLIKQPPVDAIPAKELKSAG